tara:strand:+ start:433 stop:798 length:366 start_codon:yes stop_codon:yes gene_type:complete
LPNNYSPKKTLGSALPSMIMGIVSIPMSGMGIVGIIFGVIGIILANNTIKQYNENPNEYETQGLDQANAAKICSIIGVVLSSLVLLAWVVYILFQFLWMGAYAFVMVIYFWLISLTELMVL